jgi:hypothetical protein
MTHLDIWNTNYGQMKGRELNLQFDFQPLKVGNRSDFLACKWCAIYRWKILNKGYNFALSLISIGGWHTKLWDPKVVRVPGKNAIWMWPLWRSIEYTIRVKVMVSPKSGPWWISWVRICMWLILARKMLQQCNNQLVGWFCVGLCEWISVLLFF